MSDIIAITDSNKNIVAEYRYDPWGKVLNEDNLTEIGVLNPFRYRSYYYDSDIKMYYLQSRYYDAEVGRFINCDDVNYIGVTESEVSYNPFAYCENNPVNLEDSNGHSIKKLLKALKKLLPIVKLVNAFDKYIKIKYDNNALKDENGIIIDPDRTNSTKGIISVSFEKNTDEWYQAFKYGNKFFDAITEIAFDKFRTTRAVSAKKKINETKPAFNRCFLFDKYCVSREIRLHLQGYLWAKGYENIKSVKFFRLYYKINKTEIDKERKKEYEKEYKKNKSVTIEKLYIASACKSADINESHVLYQKYEEALYFGYYLSIANCYACTANDPYCINTKKMERSPTFTRKGWINNELSCSCK